MKLYVGDRPTFLRFLRFLDFRKHDFLRFLELLHTFSRTLELTINTIATTGGRAAPVRGRLRGHHGLPGQVRVPVRARRVLRDVVQVARQDRDAAEQGSVFG